MADIPTDAENSLVEVAQALGASPSVLHIDRHVLDVGEYVLTQETQRKACGDALALARQWSAQRKELLAAGLLVSEPVVVIDDDWITASADATPPHVSVCVANDRSVFAPVRDEGMVARSRSGIDLVDDLLAPDVRLYRLDSEDPDLGGCWLLVRTH